MTLTTEIVIDIRPEAEFLQGHQQGSVYFDGVAALSERQYELPEPQQVMTIVHGSEQIADLLAWIQTKGYQHMQLQLWSEAFKEHLIRQQALATGMSDGYAWRPSKVVEYFSNNVALPDDVRLRQGLDIGCGSGRDTVYLAMQGWQMTGVDIRSEMLEKAENLASRQQVSIRTLQRDCEQLADPFMDLPDASVALINVARYLHRPLFPVIRRLLAPKGYLVYHTFMQGCEAFGSPKNPRFLLASNELATVFADYQVLCDEVITLADGRPMSAFIARKQ
jgi:SAM-dependent methyltransferase